MAKLAKPLTGAIVRNLPVPAKGNEIYYDTEVAGFGVRVTAGDVRSFVFDYRPRSGREASLHLGAGQIGQLQPHALRHGVCGIKSMRATIRSPISKPSARLQPSRAVRSVREPSTCHASGPAAPPTTNACW